MTSIDTTLTDVNYRYFLTDLVSNEVLAEVPFSGVSYERQLRKAGSFSGTIPVIASTSKLNLYESTMPGRTGLYVMRNDVCVWGGIVWARSYNESSKTLSVDASEFISYFYHRHIWQTLVYGSEFIGVSSFSVTDGTATIVTEEAHGFKQNNFVKVTFTNPSVDGTHKIVSVPSPTSFTYVVAAPNVGSTLITSGAVRKLIDTYDFVRDLLFQVATDISVTTDARPGFFANDVIEPGNTIEVSVVSKKRDEGRVILKTLEDHELVPGQEFELVEVDTSFNGYHTVVEVPDTKTVVFEDRGANIALTTLPGVRSFYITNKALTNNVATVTTHIPHGVGIGQRITLSGVDSFFSERLDENFDGNFTITATTSNTISYDLPNVRNIPSTTVSGGLLTTGSKLVYGTYGPYSSNSDIGIVVGTNETSNLYQDTQYLRGYELKSVGEILEDYSNDINGFEYRIDCDYDFTTASFTRTFVLLNIENPNPLEDTSRDLTDAERLGFNQVVFEYPGSISTFTVEESAEDSATRFFVEGNISDLSDAASQPYAAAADISLLNNPFGRSWPLLDLVEVVNNTGDEEVLYEYAKEYLYESKPPIGEFKLTVNGSLTPVIGSYAPGDWCSLIIDDPFVLARLADDQEPRDDIIVRKIAAYKVSVPDNPAFPETVDLELITDWKVDRAGEEAGLTRNIEGD
jgi:hypothetical protein